MIATTSKQLRKGLIAVITMALGFTCLVGCGLHSDPLANNSNSGDNPGDVIVVGSQDYYSNEIIAEIYAQSLENNGYTVQRKFRIGQREAYLPEMENGGIDVFPEYTGNLLQYWKKDTTARDETAVYDELKTAVPASLGVLSDAKATDQDAYVVREDFAREHNIQSLDDLSGIDELTLGGNSELETRPYGPTGLKETYGMNTRFVPIEDSGGPLTMKALKDGTINLAKINTASPDIQANNLVVLSDPKHLMLASHVVPLVSGRFPQQAQDVINSIQKNLTAEDLLAMNVDSVGGAKASDIASQWLSAHQQNQAAPTATSGVEEAQ